MQSGLLAVGSTVSVKFEEENQVLEMPQPDGLSLFVLMQAQGGDVRYVLSPDANPCTDGFLLRADAEPMLVAFVPTMTHILVTGQPGTRVVWQGMRRI